MCTICSASVRETRVTLEQKDFIHIIFSIFSYSFSKQNEHSNNVCCWAPRIGEPIQRKDVGNEQ